MSIIKQILTELWDAEFKYKGMSVNIFGLPTFKDYSKKTIRGTIDRLARNGMIEKEKRGIILSLKGKEYVKRKIDSLKNFNGSREHNEPKTLIVMFDIPTERKAEREWFRWHLKKFGYLMIQKSVWVGPNPLPKEFKEYVREIKLENCIKTFRLAKPFKIENSYFG